jgi:hypothetical protein
MQDTQHQEGMDIKLVSGGSTENPDVLKGGGCGPLEGLSSPLGSLDYIASNYIGGARYTKNIIEKDGDEIDDDSFNRLFAYVADIKLNHKSRNTKKRHDGNDVKRKTHKSGK